MTIIPQNDKIAIRLVKREERTPTVLATVVAVGPGRLLDTGVRVGMRVKVGDCVAVGRYAGVELAGGEELTIVSEDDVLAILAGT